MSSDKVAQLDAESFKLAVSTSDVPVLVDFWAPWCQPCRMMAPTVDALAEEYDGRAKICKLNIDDNGAAAAEYGVMSIPTLLIFKDGQAVERMIGVRPAADLKLTLEKYL